MIHGFKNSEKSTNIFVTYVLIFVKIVSEIKKFLPSSVSVAKKKKNSTSLNDFYHRPQKRKASIVGSAIQIVELISLLIAKKEPFGLFNVLI